MKRLAGQHRSTQRHEPPAPSAEDRDLRAELRRIAKRKPRWGYRRAHGHLRSNGHLVNRKRVQRLWREEGLRVPQKTSKRRRTGAAVSIRFQYWAIERCVDRNRRAPEHTPSCARFPGGPSHESPASARRPRETGW